MFTGIIEEKGKIEYIKLNSLSARISIYANIVLKDTKLGDSIAVNGVCLTVTDIQKNSFCADVMAETVRKTNLSLLKKNSYVNLERALTPNSRLGGHIVLGHIDATGEIIKKAKEDIGTWLYIKPNKNIDSRIVDEGSIAVDGVSLTAAKTGNGWFAVSIIPHTGAETTLLEKNKGDIVNLETDIIGKYVSRLLNGAEKNIEQKNDISIDFLAEHGFF